jgi:ADP-ribose pyrophosphatase YjhB (NUDIX family)
MARRPAPRRSGERSGPRRGHRLTRVEETSAGGLVVAGHGPAASAALIGKLDRRGRLVWSLPKGHVEDGETLEQTAAREVAEETGIAGEVLAPLGVVDYWFVAEGRRIHKTVHHYLLRAVGGELSDADGEVTEVAWVPLTELADRLVYPDERRLVTAAPDLLARSA